MFEEEIKELTLECNDTKAQALALLPYHQASEWATGWNTIATNTPCDEASSQQDEFPHEMATVETRAMTKGTSNKAELASTLHQRAAHIKDRRRTSAHTKTVCSVWNTRAKHRSDRCPLKTAMGNHIEVDYQQALPCVIKNLGILQEQQDVQIVAWMQNSQEIITAYIHCMQNYPVGQEFYSENTKPNLMKIGDIWYGFWKSQEWDLMLPVNFVFAGKNYCEPLIDEAHIATAHVGVEKTMQYLTHRYQSQSLSALVQSFMASCDTCQLVK